jgi:hypothetical protein
VAVHALLGEHRVGQGGVLVDIGLRIDPAA